LLIQQAAAIGISRVYITVRNLWVCARVRSRAPRSALSAVHPSYPVLSAAFAATHGNQTRVADLLGRFEAIGRQFM
jgi:hypothetical protein